MSDDCSVHIDTLPSGSIVRRRTIWPRRRIKDLAAKNDIEIALEDITLHDRSRRKGFPPIGAPRIVTKDRDLDDVSLPQGEFRTSVVNSAVNYSFSTKLLTSTMIQYNSADSLFNLNFRLNYIFRSGDDFFLVYNESRDRSGVRGNQTDRSIIAKLTYSFDF